MKRTRYGKIVWTSLAVLAAALTLTGCASARRTALKQAAAGSAGAIAAGDYAKALELYHALYEKDRANGKVVSRYAAVIEEVKAFGDAAEDQGRYAAAHSAFRLLAERWDGFSALGPRLSFKKADLEAQAKDCRLALCERQFRQDIAAGSFAKAIAEYEPALKDYPRDKAVKARYVKGIAEIGAIAGRALENKDYGPAGRICGLLLKHIETFQDVDAAAVEKVPTRTELAEAVKACASGLTTSGLIEYRKGNLAIAIAIWDEILAFDPGNVEIRKAAETARAQLGKLKGSGKAGSRSPKSGRGTGSGRWAEIGDTIGRPGKTGIGIMSPILGG